MPVLDATPITGDIALLTTAVTSLFQNIVDILVDAAPLLILVVGGWFVVGLIKRLLRGRA